MRFVSTRNAHNIVSFKEALLNCMPQDGGLYVPYDCDDLRHWILYANENTSFANLAGTLTSGMINKEFSPIICEAIATRAFTFEPVVRKLDKNLFLLELFHGPTGTFKDFGTSYLISALETILQLGGEKSILLDATTGELGACMAQALRGKNLVKSVLLCPAGKLRGMEESDFVWNGGNIFPIEVNGTAEDCQNLVRHFFSNAELVQKYHLTLGNSANIGRLLPQSFFYTYAFTRIKKQISGSIYYALSAGNYGNLVSGLYGWQQALPLNGFIVPETDNIRVDVQGNIMVMDSFVPLEKRKPADPASPSSLERMEHIFRSHSLMLRTFVYPADVSDSLAEAACKELYVKYHLYADRDTSAAYAATLLRKDIVEEDEGAVVLIAKDAPSLSKDFLRHTLGEEPEEDKTVTERAFKPVATGRPAISPTDISYVTSVLNSLNLLRIF